MAEPSVHLLDVNVLLALLDQAHIHNAVVADWFDTPGLQWALCPLSEAGLLRLLTHPKTGGLSMEQAAAMLNRLKQEPGWHYQPFASDWQTLTKPFFKRLHGHNQITDAYLLGLAILEDLILVTMDKAFLHLAGAEHRKHVLLLGN